MKSTFQKSKYIFGTKASVIHRKILFNSYRKQTPYRHCPVIVNHLYQQSYSIVLWLVYCGSYKWSVSRFVLSVTYIDVRIIREVYQDFIVTHANNTIWGVHGIDWFSLCVEWLVNVHHLYLYFHRDPEKKTDVINDLGEINDHVIRFFKSGDFAKYCTEFPGKLVEAAKEEKPQVFCPLGQFLWETTDGTVCGLYSKFLSLIWCSTGSIFCCCPKTNLLYK